MKFLSNLFGRKEARALTSTAGSPFCINNPAIGFLNFQGSRGTQLLEADRRTLSPLFKSSHVSSDVAQKCQVLFIYCTVDANGSIEGSSSRIRTLIKDAGAYIAVVASENAPDSYMKALGIRNDWSANIALVVDRKGDKFCTFFTELFKAMFQGNSMLMAWVKLAPQIPGRDHPDAPSTIMAAEAGHLTFKALG